ncbi:hypothetical protein KJ654_04465, partial [Patescibacteria group bacterium]|nr:hypothetical protein [Patescibacteria group bacterium]MBU1966666.1 hypothetical protein [Patescibacteria group bacterium]
IFPEIILIPASFDRYLDATKKLKKIFESISPDVYIYSLDEAFINISHCQKFIYPQAEQLGQQIQQKIKQELGSWVTANVGIGNNRLLAKIASEIAAKGSVLEINQDNLDGILASIEFKDVCGVGYQLTKKLQRLNVTHPYQLRFFTAEELGVLVGPFWANELLKIAYGQEPHLLTLLEKPSSHMKSIGRSITGFRLYDREDEIKSILFNLCSEVIDKTRKMKLAGRQITINLYGQNQAFHDHITLKYFIEHLDEMFIWVKKLYQHWNKDFKIIKFAIRLSLLEPNDQKPLLPSWHKQEKIQTALDKINAKYGLFTLHPASIMKQHLIRPEVTGFLGDRDYQLGN